MKDIKRSSAHTLLLIFSINAIADTYVVVKGDSLSKIAGKKIPGPVWGKDGSLKRVLGLNPKIKNPNFIRPGTVVDLGQINPETVIASEPHTENVMNPDNNRGPSDEDFGKPSITRFSLRASYSAISLDSVDISSNSSAVIASKYHFGLEGEYWQRWSDEFNTYVSFKFAQTSFEPSKNAGKELSTNSKFTSGIGLGMKYSLSGKMRLFGYGMYQKDFFVRSASTTETVVDTVMIPTLGAKLERDIYEKSILTFGVGGVFEQKFSSSESNYTIKNGNAFGGYLYLRQLSKESDRYFQTEFGYLQRNQDTSITKQTEKNLSLGVRYFF